jgi:hypothetical protein
VGEERHEQEEGPVDLDVYAEESAYLERSTLVSPVMNVSPPTIVLI